MSFFCDRLRHERKEWGYTQEEMAKRAGISKRTYRSYETGETPPSAKLITALAEMGADTVYLLTGRHDPALDPALDNPVPDNLPQDEQALLTCYRASSKAGKVLILEVGHFAAGAHSLETPLPAPLVHERIEHLVDAASSPGTMTA